MYKNAYSHGLQAINGERMWPKGVGYPVEPPVIRKMPGRPKKKRIRDKDEVDPVNPTRLRRSGLVMTCSNCKQVGHNRRKCPHEEIDKEPKIQGKRGRPKKQTEEAQSRPLRQRASVLATDPALKQKALKKAIAKERALARKGIGRLVSEETGNAYIHGSLTSGIYTTAGTRRASQDRASEGGTSQGD